VRRPRAQSVAPLPLQGGGSWSPRRCRRSGGANQQVPDGYAPRVRATNTRVKPHRTCCFSVLTSSHGPETPLFLETSLWRAIKQRERAAFRILIFEVSHTPTVLVRPPVQAGSSFPETRRAWPSRRRLRWYHPATIPCAQQLPSAVHTDAQPFRTYRPLPSPAPFRTHRTSSWPPPPVRRSSPSSSCSPWCSQTGGTSWSRPCTC